jgi:hypothetical protein
MNFHVTAISSNIKTGQIPVTTSHRGTCPDSCSLKGNGCYAENYGLVHHWNAISSGKRGKDYTTMIKAISRLHKGQLWRANQAGDLVGLSDKITIDQKALFALVTANKGKKGFTYTHYSVLGDSASSLANRYAIRKANKGGFIINLSADTYEEADSMQALKLAPVIVLQQEDAPKVDYTPQGNKVITCPATYRNDVTCSSCKLCAVAMDKRSVIIGFPVHGIKKKAAQKVIMLKKEG